MRISRLTVLPWLFVATSAVIASSATPRTTRARADANATAEFGHEKGMISDTRGPEDNQEPNHRVVAPNQAVDEFQLTPRLHGQTGTEIADLASPASPTDDAIVSYVGSTLWNYTRDVEVVGNYAYCVLAYGLVILDVSDPAAPVVVSQTFIQGSAYSVAVAGSYAYVVLFDVGLQIVKIDDPTDPVLLGRYEVPNPSHMWGVAVAGHYAYLATQFLGLQILDVADPSAPALVGSTTNPSGGYGVALLGNYAYVADGRRDLQIVDVADPFAPVWTGVFDVPGFAVGGIAFAGTYAYVAAGETGLLILDMTDPSAPALAGSYNTPGYAWDVAVVGIHAYVADNDSGLQILNAAVPSTPTLEASYDTPSYAWGVAAAGNYVFVADQRYGLRIVNVANPATPALAGTYETPLGAFDLAMVGNHAYVLVAPPGPFLWEFADPTAPSLMIVDIINPTAPTVVGSFHVPGFFARALDAAGDYAYVAVDGFGLQIVNVADPAAPFLAGSYLTQPNISDVVVVGNYAFLTDGNLEILNVADPANPTPMVTFQSPGQATAVTVVGDIAYVADATAGLLTVNVADPSAPVLAGYLGLQGSAIDVAVAGDYAYAVSLWGFWVLNSAMTVVNVADPTAPYPAGSYSASNSQFLTVAVAGDYAYVPNGTFGELRIINVVNPETPVLTGSYVPPGGADHVTIVGSYLCMTDLYGLQILTAAVSTGINDEHQVPTDFQLDANYPNPFNPSTAISFELAKPGLVQLRVWNVLGQRIITLIERQLPAGNHEVLWDGTSESGVQAASGVYFYTLTVGDQMQTRKMMLLK